MASEPRRPVIDIARDCVMNLQGGTCTLNLADCFLILSENFSGPQFSKGSMAAKIELIAGELDVPVFAPLSLTEEAESVPAARSKPAVDQKKKRALCIWSYSHSRLLCRWLSAFK